MSGPVVLVEPSDALPMVSVLLSFRSGSAFDPPGKEGVARIAARMIRRGADGLSSQAIEEAVDALGGELLVDTTASGTSIHFEVIKRNLEPLADLIARILAKPSFEPDELGRLLREAEAEIIEARDSDRSLASRAFRKALFGDHAYGRRKSGSIASLKTITRDDVAGFAAKHYARDNAVLAVSGDVTEDEGAALAERVLSLLPRGERVADTVPQPIARPGRHLVFVDKPDRTQTQMVLGGLGTDTHDADHFPLMVANTAFGGTFSSRVMQEVRAKRGWSYGAYSRVGFDRRRDAFTIWTAPAATDAAACLGLELELLHTLRDGGVTDDELAFSKSYIVRSNAFEIDTAKKRSHQRLEAELYEMPAGYHERFLENITRVTTAEANRAVRDRLSEDDLVIGVVGTWTTLGPALEKAIERLASATVVPFDDD